MVCANVLFLLLIVTFTAAVHATVTIRAIVDQDVQVAFNLENINSTIYWTIKNEQLINKSTIPNIIIDNLRQQNLTQLDVYNQQLDFNDPPTSSIYITFSLTGSDILNFTVNTKSMTKIYHVRTDWRNLQLNLTNEFSLDFAEYFGEPVNAWETISYTLNEETRPTYYYNFTNSGTFDPVCYFVLPAAATDVQAVGDVIIFEIPLSFGDSLLNSPFLILIVLIVSNMAFFLYRKVKK